MKQFILKVLLLGAKGVGKTDILPVTTSSEVIKPVTGFTISVMRFNPPDVEKTTTLQLWESSGFTDTTVQIAGKGTLGVILVYDVTDKATLQRAKELIEEVTSLSGRVPVLVIANRTKPFITRMVSEDEGREFSESLDGIYVEADLESGQILHESLLEFTRRILDSLD